MVISSPPPSLPVAVIELATDLFARQYGLSGPEIHRAFAQHTDVLGTYPMADKPSRWQIFQRAMDSLDENAQRLVLYELLDREWPNLDTGDLDKLRQRLASGTRHTASQLGERLERLDWAAVDRAWKDAIELVDRNPEGAIRAARTFVESVCKHVCDERGEPYPEGGDLSRLYKAAARSLGVAPDQHSEKVIKQILSGAATVVDGLASLRNSMSDAHGRGKSGSRPGPRHARLAVNMAFGLATFLVDTHVEKPAV
jgi:hypothetical protein